MITRAVQTSWGTSFNTSEAIGETIPTFEEETEHLEGLTKKKKQYQLYMKKYLRCVKGVDDNVGRVLDYLDESGLTENTVVMYTGDQGFFLGEHGLYDKRIMYEEAAPHALFGPVAWPRQARLDK